MTRPIYADINLPAIRANHRLAQALAPGRHILSVIKANAYGHGAAQVARCLQDETDGFALASCAEALELRDSGIRKPLLLLEGLFDPNELEIAIAADLALVVHSRQQMHWLLRRPLPKPIWVWLKLDTGMHRLGLTPEEVPEIHAALRDCPWIQGPLLMTHLACAPEPGSVATQRQLQLFERLTRDHPGLRSLSNSAGLMAWPEAHGDWLRPGIMLYGANPLDVETADTARLRPAMRLHSRLIAVRELALGEAIGYGGRFVCERRTRVGVVAAGYADGYPRHAPDGTPVAVAGQLTRLIGRVSMDMLTVDLTEIPDASPGDPVELWGEQVRADQVARAAETIAYELFTGVAARVPRSYRNAGD